LRARWILGVSSQELAKFAQTNWATHSEMLASYNTLMAPLRGLKKKITDLKNEASQAEWEIAQCKTIDDAGKKERAEKIKANKAKMEVYSAEFHEARKVVTTPVYDSVFEVLARSNPPNAPVIAQNLGVEMNDLAVSPSAAIVKNLRKIYFGDKEGENSEVFFKIIERPDKMLFVTGDAKQINQKVMDIFEKKGTETFDKATIDRKTVLGGNEPDHAKRLMDSMKK